MFVSNPRAWAEPRHTGPAAEEFRREWALSGLGPLVAHAPYVVNIASSDPRFLERSRTLGARSVEACELLGVEGFVVHAGSGGADDPAVALERAAESLRDIASASTGRTKVLVELTAGTRGAVAATFPEAARLFDASGADPRLGLCIDTCHLFAAGYGLDEPEGVETCFGDLRANGLQELLALVHANDARFPRGSRLDRHANVGEGHIGVEGFRAIVNRPDLAGLPVVLETPGDAQSYLRQIELLRSLVRS
jgi:deoxyribonuclease-4